MYSNLKITVENGRTTVKIFGNFDFKLSRQFLEQLPELISNEEILIDFSDCGYLDSSGLGCILKLKKSLSDSYGAAKIEYSGCNEKILNVLEMMKIN